LGVYKDHSEDKLEPHPPLPGAVGVGQRGLLWVWLDVASSYFGSPE